MLPRFQILSRPQAGARNISADVVVYGLTPGGITTAIECRRHGLSVVMVSGERENRVGGMMSNGLGETDLYNHDALGGLSREVFDRIDAHYGRARDAAFTFEPSVAKAIFDAMLAEAGVPVYYTRGIDACSVSNAPSGRRVTGLRTRDGLSVTGNMFVDAGYEGDLIAFAGISYVTGREANRDYGETVNGVYRPSAASTKHQFVAPGNIPLNVDPWRTPGVPASGLLPNVVPDTFAANGEADGAVQAYNFRMCLSGAVANRKPLMSSPPAGWDPLRYEALGRFLAQATAQGIAIPINYVMIVDQMPNNKRDINAYGGLSTDPFGINWNYPEAGFNYATNRQINYALRETIFRATEAHIRGLFYYLQTHADARVPQALRDQVRTLWLCLDEFTTPWEGDEQGWQSQIYVREARRMRSDYVLRQSDITRGDVAPPYADSVVALASYPADSHHVRTYAEEISPGVWRCRNEGDFFIDGFGGANQIVPIPWEVMRPRKAECVNLVTPWSISCTHAAMGTFRMEATSMTAGHACGAAVALALGGLSQSAVQDVPVSEIRAMLREEGGRIDAI